MFRKTVLVSLALVLAACIQLVYAQQGGTTTKTSTLQAKIVLVDAKRFLLKVELAKGEGDEAGQLREFEVSRNVRCYVDRAQKLFDKVEEGKDATLTITSTDTGEFVSEIRIGKQLAWWVVALSLVGAIVGSVVIGNYLASSFRMADYGWKIGLILGAVAFSSVIIWAGWPPRWGVDLRGGVTLIYEIAEPAESGDENEKAKRPTAEVLATLLADRVDPSGTKEIVIRPFGPDRIEIIIPDVGPAEIENIKRRLTQAGYLQFRIVANDRKHKHVIERAKESKQKGETFVKNSSGKPIGQWVKVGKEDPELAKGSVPDFKAGIWSDTIRDRQSGELINFPDGDIKRQSRRDPLFEPRNVNFAEYLLRDYPWRDEDGNPIAGRELGGITEIEVLMHIDDRIDLEGTHLSSVLSSFDQYAKPCINFVPTTLGSRKFGALTNSNLPEGQQTNRLGIVLDNTLISAPSIQGVITSRGQITGSFTKEEVEELVNILRAGQLPAALNEQPLSEDRIDSHLGIEMRESGQIAIGVSLLVVIGFMIFYYGFCGAVACFALITNLICIVAMIILVKQPFSLTGLAGLVLTVGMSVDANVLIFERIREEIDRGSTLRMAIRNGFGKATTTIVDANLTTLITAIVLYAIGTEQIRGFAVTLILGILMCMFTAIFCSRVIFDIAERQKWIAQLGMRRWVRPVSFDFIGKRTVAMGISVMLIVIGLVAVSVRSKGIYAIDLSGGYSVRVVMAENTKQDKIREQLAAQLDDMKYQRASVTYTVSPMPDPDNPSTDGTYEAFKIDISVPAPSTKEGVQVKGVDDADVRKLTVMNYQKEFSALDTNDDDVLSKAEFEELPSVRIAQLFELLPDLEKGTEVETDEAGERLFQYLDNDGNDELRPIEFVWLQPQEIIKEIFRDGDNSLLVMNSLEFTEPVEVAMADDAADTTPADDDATSDDADDAPADDDADSAASDDDAPADDASDDAADSDDADSNDSDASDDAATDPDSNEDTSDDSGAAIVNPETDLLALANIGPLLVAQVDDSDADDDKDTDSDSADDPDTDADNTTNDAASNDDSNAADEESFETDDGETTEASDESSEEQPNTTTEAFKSELKLGYEVERETLFENIKQAAQRIGVDGLADNDIELESLDESNGSNRFKQWSVLLDTSKEDAEKILAQLKSDVSSEPHFRGSSEVGTSIANNTQVRALGAILASLLGIVAYIWIRFQKVVFGLAAVVALIHDVLFVLGAIAVSLWLPQVLGMEEFKISLPVVAAFLTIIGYSLNDTIVVFDRIREVRGKSPELTGDMINRSIGQTLSRTILTSLTTLIVVVILYGWGGEAIHGFAYALVVGVFVGTYSSIFVASPVLLWLSGADNPAGNTPAKKVS